MQHHIYLLSSLIISFYILTKFLLCYMFSKGHVTFIFGHFSVCFSNLGNFFYLETRNHFRDEITRLVINTRLITTLKNVDMFKIIEFLLIYAFRILRLKALRKFHYAFFGRWFCRKCVILYKMVANFKQSEMQVLISFYFTRIM